MTDAFHPMFAVGYVRDKPVRLFLEDNGIDHDHSKGKVQRHRLQYLKVLQGVRQGLLEVVLHLPYKAPQRGEFVRFSDVCCVVLLVI